MTLKDRIIVVTGGATGIGRGTAVCCAKAGAQVVIADLNDEGMGETVDIIESQGGAAVMVHMDISSESDVEQLMNEAAENYGRIDALINSAGVLEGPFVHLEDFEEYTFDRVVDINLKGSFFAAKHAGRHMRRQGDGVVILISSGAGVHGGSSSVAYASSKGGVHGLSLVLRGQLEPLGIRVNCVCPGGINSPLKLRVIEADAVNKRETDEERAAEVARQAESLGDPIGVGKVLAFLASDDADYVRGTIFVR